MQTKSVNAIAIDKATFDEMITQAFVDFMNDTKRSSLMFDIIDTAFASVKALLKDRFVVLEDGDVFDTKVCGCWEKRLLSGAEQKYFDAKIVVSQIPKGYDAPTQQEIGTLRGLSVNLPFELYDGRPVGMGSSSWIWENNFYVPIWVDRNFPHQNSSGTLFPLKRLYKQDTPITSHKCIFLLWLANGLMPEDCASAEYRFLYDALHIEIIGDIEGRFTLNATPTEDIETLKLPNSKCLMDMLLTRDTIRADIKPYHAKMLEDTEQGYWDLWDQETNESQWLFPLSTLLVARDPKSSIKDGVVGIDFGTKSTVVVYQEDTERVHPMRVGTGDLSKTISKNHYENPTVMECNNLSRFIEAYTQKAGRPNNRWEDITISHTALNAQLASPSSDYNTYISDLKQWAGNKNKKLKVVDRQGKIIDLPTFIEIDEKTFNPIEIYAYYLGLYINNQHNGIYLHYILSFPVTYEVEIRNKIAESFKRGIAKSLPPQLHTQEILQRLEVLKGASEPAAYAVVALQAYGFEPVGDEKVFYGIFDFGGGTTDFDFGIWREASGIKESRYDYAIEHFGAGGDRYLGGENLLELLAFELFKANTQTLLAQEIQFILPPECHKFMGSETLLSQSQEAKMNTKMVMEKLRPLWENDTERLSEFEQGTLKVNLVDAHGKQQANFELKLNREALIEILTNRIDKGIKNFFEALRLAFANAKQNVSTIKEINIFLAGNASKSPIVTELFAKETQKTQKEIAEFFKNQNESFFQIFPPLGLQEENLEKPNGKTGVAFGLIETRKSGKILVIDHNIQEDIRFKYYLGMNKKRRFATLIDRETVYNVWKPFLDASVDHFDLYYTMSPLASTNTLAIDDHSINKRIFKTGTTHPEALIYMRVINPTTFEYVVADEEGIKQERFLCDIQRISL